MKVTAVFTAILSLAVAYTDLRLTDDAAIGNIPRVQFVPIAAGADHSAIPVKVAHSLIRTYGFNKPSDADIDDFAEDNDYSDEDAPYDLRSLYTAPVLIFLEDAGNNAIAYYADRGINTIKAYPENYAILNRLLDTSNAVVLSYRPEKYLYPADRYAVSNRFFTPTNYKNALVLAYARAPENNRVNDAPLVFRKYEIPSSYSPTRTQYAEYDIDRIPYAYKYPATLKPTNVPEYSLLKERIPFSTYATDADYTYSKLLDGYTLKYYCAKYPYACSRLAQPGVSPVTVPIDPAKVATLKSETENIKKPLDAGSALNPCAKNPLACGIPLRTAPYLVKSPTITNRPLAYIPYNSDPLYDAKINNLHHKQIIPNIAYKYNSPVVPSDDYLDDYYPATIPSTDLSQGGILKTLLRPF